LEESLEGVCKIATRELQNLNVGIKLQTRVVGSIQLGDGRQGLTLSSGDKLLTDMYIPAFGLTKLFVHSCEVSQR
jgi:hypothetical protein